MSNVRGIVKFEADGATYSLHFGINALVDLEDALGVSTSEIGKKLSGDDGTPVKLKDMRILFRCGLGEYWEGQGPTDRQAGEIMDIVGLGRAAELIGEAFAAAFPDAVTPVDEGSPSKSGNARKK